MDYLMYKDLNDKIELLEKQNKNFKLQIIEMSKRDIIIKNALYELAKIQLNGDELRKYWDTNVADNEIKLFQKLCIYNEINTEINN